eukprot:6476653-Amphidinium_carterae.2
MVRLLCFVQEQRELATGPEKGKGDLASQAIPQDPGFARVCKQTSDVGCGQGHVLIQADHMVLGGAWCTLNATLVKVGETDE